MKRKTGFTLIEVVVVMAIFSVVVGLIVFSYRKGKVNNELRLASRELLADLDYTKSLAQKNAVDSGLTLQSSPSGASYTIGDSDGQVYRKVSLPEGITCTAYTHTVSAYGSCSTVTFYSNSTTAFDYTISLENSATSKLFVITILGTTGMLKLSETEKLVSN